MKLLRTLAAAAALVLAATPTPAQVAPHPVSAEIAETGLAATGARLAALPDPNPAERLALGAVRFLGGVERALALRWQRNIGAGVSGLPMLRVPLPQNPAAEPFAPGDVARLFRDLAADMEAARAPLADAMGEVGEVELALDLADLWFDIDGDGARAHWEEVARYLPIARSRGLVVNFDTADRDWLLAYTHLLSATAEAALAFDPTVAIAAVGADSAALAPFLPPPGTGGFGAEFRPALDYLAILRDALDQPPDAAALGRAHAHLRSMIAANRAFWTAVAAETDDRAEWIPSATQTSALGLEVPGEAGPRWLAILDEAEAVLDGRKLLRHGLLAEDVGIDVAAYVADPRPIDILAWLHGRGALPYLARGEIASAEAWRAFVDLVGRQNGVLFAVLFN